MEVLDRWSHKAWSWSAVARCERQVRIVFSARQRSPSSTYAMQRPMYSHSLVSSFCRCTTLISMLKTCSPMLFNVVQLDQEALVSLVMTAGTGSVSSAILAACVAKSWKVATRCWRSVLRSCRMPPMAKTSLWVCPVT